MSIIDTNLHLPSYIKENIISIRNYLKEHELKSMKIEDNTLTISNSDGIVIDLNINNHNIDNHNINNYCDDEIVLPVNNDSQLRAAKDILSSAKRIIEVMIDDDVIELMPHPALNSDVRQEIERLYNSCQNPSSKGVSNKHRFTAGYYALLDEGGDRWTRTISNFQRGCKIYYELIRLIIANIIGVEEYGEEWKHHIKKDIFYVNIKPAYFKDINRKNWPVVRQTVINYCRYYLQPQQRQQLQQQQRQQRQFLNLFSRFYGF